MVNKKHSFWQALISAIIIFAFGLILGLWLEEARETKIETQLLETEINMLDSQLISKVNKNLDIDCELSKNQIFDFADQIYKEAELLEKYDSSSQLSKNLNILHKRYDLLRVMLWSESTEIKRKCNSNFHTVIYLFQYNDATLQTKSKQTAFARFLEDLKEKYGAEILLIPLAGDLNLSSIELVKKNFNIGEIPSIIINEKIVISTLDGLENIENIIFEANNVEKIVLMPNNKQ